ncbi:glycoside hydrolase family 26 protein [Quadrisphaera sp. KR29]|uniref:glycoside hydrolase family 26 protein n=1 Tax=Quadrisphaera sp. KR29 TaxID=3461391 RepID=UPI004043AE40
MGLRPGRRTRSAWRAATAVTAALAALVGTAAVTAPAAAAPAPAAATAPSWPSGVWLPSHGVEDHEAFARWRGRPLQVVVDATDRRTWADATQPRWLLEKWAASTVPTVVISVAMVPDEPTATLATCAAGTDDAHWARFGQEVAASGLADRLVLRLGWELNGDWQKWSAHDPAAFVACWHRVHDAVEAAAPAVRWDWNVNRGVGQGLPDGREAYPGDAYVDVISVDSYDVFPAVVDEATWQEHYAGPYGLRFWADFAASRGKRFGVPEWGLYPGPGNTGPNAGDNPFFIAKMHGFFAEVAPDLAYEAYFSEDMDYSRSSIWGPDLNPRAASAYASLFASS